MFIDLNGVSHHYASNGEGPPIVLLHGLGASLHIWYAAMQNLALHHHVVALDLRGTGRSHPGTTPTTIPGWAHDLATLITTLEPAPRHLSRPLPRRVLN